MDIDIGKVKIRKKGGAGSHNGMKSVVEDLKSENFPRIRVGIGTPKDNVRDLIERQPEKYYSSRKNGSNKIKGLSNPSNKLSEENVKTIYKSKLSNRILAKKFNISSANVWQIKYKKTWKWLTDTLD